jgi:predicted metal-dependent hydrolase
MSLDRDDPQLELLPGRDPAQPWEVRESRRAQRLTVRVFRTGQVEVVVPPRTSRRTVASFLQRHRAWIERKRQAARAALPAPEPFPPAVLALAASGQSWLVDQAAGARRRSRDPAVLSLRGATQSAEDLQRSLQRWLIAFARAHLGALLEQLAQQHGFSYRRLQIRRQRTRWGSCSTRGTISLNVGLMFQRPEVVRYLLLHELVHTRHMNHSPRFWRCVERYDPNWRVLDRELLESGWRRVPQWVCGERARRCAS